VDASKIIQISWLPQLLSSYKRAINSFARDYWNRHWESSETGILYKKRWHNDGIVLNRHVNKLYSVLSLKAKASVLIQMRTEKIALHGYLYKINRSEEPWYGYGQTY
jgi:hypothetical protein